MSSNLRRLRRMFQWKPTGTTSAEAHFSEEHLEHLVNLFKKKSDSKHFRRNRGDDHLEHLVNIFKKKLDSKHFRRNPVVYKFMIERLARENRFSSIHDIFNHLKQYPDITDENFSARLVVSYGKSKMFDHALNLFDELPELNCPRTVLSFNALLAACIASKEFEKVNEIFREIPGKLSIEPDVVSYNTMIEGFCKVGSFDAAVSLLDEMEKNSIKPNWITFKILLGSLYRGDADKFSKAETFWSLMQEKEVVPDVRTYNSRLHGLMRQKRLSEAVNVFKDMEERGLQPNHYSYNAMIKACVDQGKLEEAKKWYASMISNGLMPDFFTFTKLIPCACSKNDIDFAHELCIKSFDIKRPISRGLIQTVADALIEQSEAGKAEELLKLRDSKGSAYDGNSMPAGGE